MTARKSKNHVEAETKISLSRADLEMVLLKLQRKAAEGTFRHKYVPRRYFDTPNLELHNVGLSLRVQYAAGKSGTLGSYEQTFKYDIAPQDSADDASAEVRARREVRDAIPTHMPDIAATNDAPTKELLKDVDNKSLRHIFTASIERRLFEMPVGKQGKVELAFDCGTIYLADDPQCSVEVDEVEIEVKKGSPAIIAEIREMILDMASTAEIQPLSKAEQGVKLYSEYKANNL
jgi:inorganic triphosphatase YgiF